MKPFILGTIFARGGSKGVPRKNIRLLNGKPLIAYSIEVGLSVPAIDRLIVSTDDEKIADTAKWYGAEVLFMRPRELAQDDSPELLSWKHAIKTFEETTKIHVDILVSIPATSPLRIREDVAQCIDKLVQTGADGCITIKDADRSPYFNMVALDEHENASLVIKPKTLVSRRQDSPKVYDITTVAYAVRREFIMKAGSLFEGKVTTVHIPRERAIDIDTVLDFEIAEFLMQRVEGKV